MQSVGTALGAMQITRPLLKLEKIGFGLLRRTCSYDRSSVHEYLPNYRIHFSSAELLCGTSHHLVLSAR